MAEVENCPIFLADFDTKIVNETEISLSDDRKTEIVNIIVTDIGNYRS